MAFGRSNSLSLNTGASNNLFMSKPTAFQAIIASLASPKRNSGTPFTMLTPQPQPPPQPPSQSSLTKATSSGQQNQRQQNNPPPSQAGSLFGGGAAAQSQAQTGQAGGLFGATQAAAQPQQQIGGLFGNTQAAQPQATSLFGNSQAAQPPATGLFGNTQAPQAQSSSLFGNTNAQPSTSLFGNTNAQPSTSLFGNTNAQPSTSLFGNTNAQPSASSFGNTNAQPSTSLFGNSLAQPQPQQTGSMFANMNNNTSSSNLFGNSTTAPPNNNTTGSSSLFGSLGQQSQPQSNMFGMSNQNQNQPTNNSSVFGMSAIAPQQLNTSLLSASQYRASNLPAPFVGTLSMGQPGSQSTQSQQQQQQAGSSGLGNTIGAVKIHTADLRGTTRFADCHESIQEQFESVDTMIQKQERFCREIQALLQKHEQDILCLPPSVQVIGDLAENVETLLSRDAQGVQSAKAEASRQRRDFERAGRVAENLMLGAVGYAVPSSSMAGYGNGGHGGGEGEEGFDTDLIGNYFVPMVAALQGTLEGYAANLADIEGHLGVIEGSAVAQARRLSAKRAGVGSGGAVGGDETVRELAETLTGFEQSLLGVAGVVGECREGVDGLVLGGLGGRVGAGAGGGMARRPW